MRRTRPPYAPEFRQRMIDLVRSGRTPEELAEEFEPTAQSILTQQAGITAEQIAQPEAPTTSRRRKPPDVQT